jgi:hypothetical protein
MPVNIERVSPRDGIAERPVCNVKGFKLADPKYGNEMHHAKFAVYVTTLDEAADLIEKNQFSLWMVRQGKRASLISPSSLRIFRT